jgi:predicted GTPase
MSSNSGLQNPRSKHALVAVMGPTGAGKSSFIAGITGADVGVCRTLHSGTRSDNSLDNAHDVL